MKKLTIPEIRHCMLALATRLEVEENTMHPSRAEVAAMLRYLAEQTRRAPRGSKGDVDGSNIPPQDDPPPVSGAGLFRDWANGSDGKPQEETP